MPPPDETGTDCMLGDSTLLSETKEPTVPLVTAEGTAG